MAFATWTLAMRALCGIDPTQKLVLLVLADFARPLAYPSVSTIARLACISDQRARVILHALAKAGWLTIEARSVNGRPTTNSYVLNVARMKDAAAGTLSPATGIDPSPATGIDPSPTSVTPVAGDQETYCRQSSRPTAGNSRASKRSSKEASERENRDAPAPQPDARDADERSLSDPLEGKATTLPPDFTLPAEWSASVKAIRPDLTDQALRISFAKFLMDKRGQAFTIERWRAKGESWLCNERGPRASGGGNGSTAWATSPAGIEAKGAELGMLAYPGETHDQFAERIRARARTKFEANAIVAEGIYGTQSTNNEPHEITVEGQLLDCSTGDDA